jgi:tetratricopeptide (TPR) repeat protein
MKKIAFILLSLGLLTGLQAQPVTLPSPSKKAMVAEWIGLTQVKIEYHRPGVRGREGQIYGGIVPIDGGNPIPWRAGADENTTISFEDDVLINGKSLKAGKYGFHIALFEDQWVLIFSNNHWSWGSYFYDSREEALRVGVQPMECDHVEWLEFRFVNQTDNSADIQMAWERKMVRFTVEVDVYATVLERIEKELDGIKGFSWEGWNSAAQYCLQAGKDLDKALIWAEVSLNPNQGGERNFTTLSTKARILEKLGRNKEAEPIMTEAIAMANMRELHFYGRTLIDQGQPEKALEIFELNRTKNPLDQFTTFVGLGRGNMAAGNFKEAAAYFRKAAPNAPSGQERFYEDLAKQCEEKMKK